MSTDPDVQILSTVPADDRASSPRRRWLSREFLASWGTVGVLLLLIIAGAAGHASSFLTTTNVGNVLTSGSFTVMIALGLTIVLIVGEYDLSVAAIGTVAGAGSVGMLAQWGVPWVLSILCALVIAGLTGAWNGMLVTRLRINSFIATLGTSTIVIAIAYVLTGGQIQSVPPGSGYSSVGRAAPFWGIAVPAFVAVVVAVILATMYRRAVIGRHMYAIGGNRAAARVAGIRVDHLVRVAFVGGAVVAGAGGILYSMYQGYADINLTGGYLLPAFSAAFIGAATLRIGLFHVWGTVLGAVILEIVTVLVVLYGLPQSLSLAFQGIVLIVAVALSSLLSPRRP